MTHPFRWSLRRLWIEWLWAQHLHPFVINGNAYGLKLQSLLVGFLKFWNSLASWSSSYSSEVQHRCLGAALTVIVINGLVILFLSSVKLSVLLEYCYFKQLIWILLCYISTSSISFSLLSKAKGKVETVGIFGKASRFTILFPPESNDQSEKTMW